MHPCANRSGGPNTKKILLAHCAWSPLPIGGGGHRCANILAHRSTLHAHTTIVRKGHTDFSISCNKFHIAYWRTEHFGAPCLFSSQSPINPHQNDQGRKGPCSFQRLIALKCLKFQKIKQNIYNPPLVSYLSN